MSDPLVPSVPPPNGATDQSPPRATTSSPPQASSPPQPQSPLSPRGGPSGVPLAGNCIECGVAMGRLMGSMSDDGPLHNDCVVKYRLKHVERCCHCDRALKTQRVLFQGKKFHSECLIDFKGKMPFVPRSIEGTLLKFSVGRSSGFFGGKNWKERYFVLSPKSPGLAYYESLEAKKNGKPPSSVIPLTKGVTRLITRPMKRHHPEATNVSKEFVVIFQDGSKEHRLLCQCKSWEEQAQWCDILADYIRDVDAFQDGVEIVS